MRPRTAPSPQSHRLRAGAGARIRTHHRISNHTAGTARAVAALRALRVPRSSPPSAVVGRAAGTWWRRHGMACMRFSDSRVCRTSTRGKRAAVTRRASARAAPHSARLAAPHIAVQPRSRLAFTARRRAGSSGLNSYPYAVGVVSTVVAAPLPSPLSPAPRGGTSRRRAGRGSETPTWTFRITGTKAHRQTKTTHRRPRLKSPFTKHYGNVKKRKTRLLTLLSRLGLRMDTAHSTAHRGRLESRGSMHRANSWFHAMRVALGACAMRAAGSTMPRGVVGSPPGVCPPPRRTRPAAPHASTHYSGSSAF